MTELDLPKPCKLLYPVLEALAELGGSASISEIVELVIKREGFSDAQQAVMHGGGPQTEIAYQLAWARTGLKAMGLLTNSSRGIWTLTEGAAGLLNDAAISDEQRRSRVDELWTERQSRNREARNDGSEASVDSNSSSAEVAAEVSWKEELLAHLLRMQPDAFERLAQRLLREADFESVTVTGKSGDGGIDGLGVYRLGLVSFPVFFQCKRYQGSVGSGTVRDFRGAIAGRGDKGLLITTGTFTAEAKKEATRDGATPIDLIDGDRLCDLLKKYALGVQTCMVEEVTVDAGFFAEL